MVDRKEYLKEYHSRPENKERERIYRKFYRQTEQGKASVKRCNTKYYKETKRNCHLKEKYGLTLAEYNDLLRKQNYKCAICETEYTGGKKQFNVDHCHKTGKVREILCDKCNWGLGSFNDDPKLLDKASNYLRKYDDKTT